MRREAYGSLHGLGTTRIRRIAHVAVAQTPTDNRGRHNVRPRAITEELKTKIHQHILTFPYETSHYGRKRSKKRYLHSEMSILCKMYPVISLFVICVLKSYNRSIAFDAIVYCDNVPAACLLITSCHDLLLIPNCYW